MKKLLMLAGAATMLASAPALAEKPGKGQGQKADAVKQVGQKASTRVDQARAMNAIQSARVLRDRNRNGLDDGDEALARKYGGALCPPGLANKTPACMPPGQARRMFREGQRLSSDYRYYTPYDDIPLVLRERYDLDDDYRYIYRDNVIYVVDPETRLVRSILDAIIPG
jgi:hypothetical protein